jgi:hypothetical protein
MFPPHGLEKLILTLSQYCPFKYLNAVMGGCRYTSHFLMVLLLVWQKQLKCELMETRQRRMEGWGGTAHSEADTTADTDSTTYTAHNSTMTTADIAHSRYSTVDTTHITQPDRQNSNTTDQAATRDTAHSRPSRYSRSSTNSRNSA